MGKLLSSLSTVVFMKLEVYENVGCHQIASDKNALQIYEINSALQIYEKAEMKFRKAHTFGETPLVFKLFYNNKREIVRSIEGTLS